MNPEPKNQDHEAIPEEFDLRERLKRLGRDDVTADLDEGDDLQTRIEKLRRTRGVS